jgi:hypothetical protein
VREDKKIPLLQNAKGAVGSGYWSRLITTRQVVHRHMKLYSFIGRTNVVYVTKYLGRLVVA